MRKNNKSQAPETGYVVTTVPPQTPVAVTPQIIPAQNDIGKRTAGFIKGSVKLTFKYFFTKLLISVIMGLISSFVFTLLKMPVPWLWGVIIAIGNAIPVFGQWISGIIVPGVLLFFDLKFAVFSLLTIVILQVLDDFVFTPLIVGKSLSFKPILIITVTLLAGAFLNFWGILFAVPIAAVIKLAYDIFFLKRDVDESINGDKK